jgi:hypothetical protein
MGDAHVAQNLSKFRAAHCNGQGDFIRAQIRKKPEIFYLTSVCQSGPQGLACLVEMQGLLCIEINVIAIFVLIQFCSHQGLQQTQ